MRRRQPSTFSKKVNSRKALAGFVVAEVLLAVAIPVLVLTGFRAVLDSTEGQFEVELTEDDPGWRSTISPTPVTAIVQVDGDQIVDLALAVEPSSDSASRDSAIKAQFMRVPLGLQTDNGLVSELEPGQATEAVSAQLRIKIDNTRIVEESEWNDIVPARGNELVRLSPDPGLLVNERLLLESIPFPSGSTAGDRLKIRILDRVGSIDLDEAARRFASLGAEVVEVGNAAEFDNQETVLITPSEFADPQLSRLTRNLGEDKVVVDEEATDEVVTVVIGNNFTGVERRLLIES